MYYARVLTWLLVAALVVAPIVGHRLWSRGGLAMGGEEAAAALRIADYYMACTLCSGALYWFLLYSLTSSSTYPELYALRCASALLAAVALVELTVQALPRPVLAAATALYVGLSLNVCCWWASLVLRLQTTGLGGLLPEGLVHVLLQMRWLDWLRSDSFTVFLGQCRQLMPVVFLPEDELHLAVERLPPELRERILTPGIQQHLPDGLRNLVRPWAAGPDGLRVRHVSLLPGGDPSSGRHRGEHGANGGGGGGGGVHGGGGGAVTGPPPAPLGAPEWLLLYALRRHAMRAARRRADLVLSGDRTHLGAALGLGAALWFGRLAPRLEPARRRMLLTLARRLLSGALPIGLLCYAISNGGRSGLRRRMAAAAADSWTD